MDIKYVEVPVRVKPHKEYLDMKGVDALWEQIKEYVGEHSSQGSVNAEEVNAIIEAYYAAHRDELKGEPFTFEDLTEEQIEALRGADGTPGRDGMDGYTPQKGIDYFDGKDGVDGTVSFDELTEEQRASLKGDKGDTGETGAAFTYDMFTPEQLEALRGPKGADGTMTFSDLTDEQREQLRGPQGIQGPQGDPFSYSMFTEEQLEALRGPQGIQGERGERGEMGPAGPQGVQGIPGKQGEAAKVDYSLVYTRTEVDELLKTVDVNIDDINLENYYAKDETYNKEEVYNKPQIDNLISSLVIEGAAGVHIGDTEPTIAGVSVWVDTDGIPYEWEQDLTEVFYKKEYIDETFENHVHRLSEMENDIGFVTTTEAVPTKVSQLDNDCGYVRTEDVYKRPEVYTKTEMLTTLADYWKKTDTLPDGHVHMNKNILDKMYELNGNLMYNGMQIGGAVTDGNGSEIDLSLYALQSDVNRQYELLSDAKVNKDTYTAKISSIESSMDSLNSKITKEAVDRANADTNITTRVANIENKDYQTEADVLLLIQNAGITGGGEVDLTGIATETYVQEQIAAIEHPTTDLSDYYNKSSIDTKLSEKAPFGHQHDNYLTSSTLPTQLNTAVDFRYARTNDNTTTPASGAWKNNLWDAKTANPEGKYLWMELKHGNTSDYYCAPWEAEAYNTGSSVDLTPYAKLNDTTQTIKAQYLHATGVNIGVGSFYGNGTFRLTGTWDGKSQNLYFPLENGTLATQKYVDDAVANAVPEDVDLTNYYNKSQVDTLVSAKANSTHTHTASQITGGKLIKSHTYTYNRNNSSTEKPTTWYTDRTQIPAGTYQFSWTKEVTTYTDGTSSTGYLISKIDQDMSGYLKYEVVTAAPAEQQEGVLYIVTE
jgi:hypothetical protein